jgi:hypothetical protein
MEAMHHREANPAGHSGAERVPFIAVPAMLAQRQQHALHLAPSNLYACATLFQVPSACCCRSCWTRQTPTALPSPTPTCCLRKSLRNTTSE